VSRRAHKIDPDSFCYVCDQFISRTKRKLTMTLRKAYCKCFKINCSGIENNFAPSYICLSFQKNLYRYHKNNAHYMPITCPAIWVKSSSHDKGTVKPVQEVHQFCHPFFTNLYLLERVYLIQVVQPKI